MFWIRKFPQLCILRRHSLSNHFLLEETEDNLVYQCFAAVKRIHSTASREELNKCVCLAYCRLQENHVSFSVRIDVSCLQCGFKFL